MVRHKCNPSNQGFADQSRNIESKKSLKLRCSVMQLWFEDEAVVVEGGYVSSGFSPPTHLFRLHATVTLGNKAAVKSIGNNRQYRLGIPIGDQ